MSVSAAENRQRSWYSGEKRIKRRTEKMKTEKMKTEKMKIRWN